MFADPRCSSQSTLGGQVLLTEGDNRLELGSRFPQEYEWVLQSGKRVWKVES